MIKPAETSHADLAPENDKYSQTASAKMVEEVNSEHTKTPSKSPSSEPDTLTFDDTDIYAPKNSQGRQGEAKSETGDSQPATNTRTQNKDGWEVTYTGGEDHPTQLKKDDTTINLPEGATNLQIKDGLPTYTKNGVTVALGADGKEKAYHSNGFTFEHHEDNDTWYYHQDSGGDYVQIDVPTLKEDGSVTTKEYGGFNSGREHSLTATGQTTENAFTQKLDQAKDLGSDAFEWVKDNKALTTMPLIALPALGIDKAFGTDIYGVQNAFVNGLGESLVDGTVNGVVYLGGLAQGGLQNIGALPEDWKKIDQIIPQLDLYQFDSENATTAEKWAHGIGEVTGYVVPFAGAAGATIKATKATIGVIREGRVLSTLSESAGAVVQKLDDAGSALVNKLLRRESNGVPAPGAASAEVNQSTYANLVNSEVSSKDILASINPSNKLGEGYANAVYRMNGNDDFVLRLPKEPGLIPNERLTNVHDYWPEGNVGQPIARMGNVEVLKKVDGRAIKEAPRQEEMGGLRNVISRQSPQARHARQERVIAGMPQSAYDNFASDLVELSKRGRYFDSVNPGNVLISDQKFSIVDVGSTPIKIGNDIDPRSAGVGLYEMLRPLTGTRVDNFVPATGRSLGSSYQKIIEKSITAAEKAGVAIVPDARLEQLFTAAGIPERYKQLVQGKNFSPGLEDILRKQYYQ